MDKEKLKGEKAHNMNMDWMWLVISWIILKVFIDMASAVYLVWRLTQNRI